MIFKDRADAAGQLFQKLKNDPLLKKRPDVAVVSLLRGGVILGKILSEKLRCSHLPLVCTKIGAPDNEELAIGALAYDVVYLEARTINSLSLSKKEITAQIEKAKEKLHEYNQTFELNENLYQNLSEKTVVLVDDGVATGATMKTAALFVKEKRARIIVIATPVSSDSFDFAGVDKTIILHRDPYFSAVSQFYEDFPQIEDTEVKKILKKSG